MAKVTTWNSETSLSAADVHFRYASPGELSIIQAIAHQTWPVTYGEMISREQLDYMIRMIYSEHSIKRQMEVMRHEFVIGSQARIPFGFASVEQDYGIDRQLMIHKLYVLPAFQGRGLGKMFIGYITKLALEGGQTSLCLKVFHKNIRAITFYKNLGFSICGEDTSDIGSGYRIFDYVMLKNIGK